MSSYLLQENGDKIALEDGTGFLLLESGAVVITITGRFDAPSPAGNSGDGSPGAGMFDRANPAGDGGAGSPASGSFDPAFPGVTNA